MSEALLIREVGLRDGLQSIAQVLPTDAKRAWCRAQYAAGMREVEIGAMVPAHLLPQLADGDEMVEAGLALPGLTVSVLAPNARGVERALALGVHKINYVLSASESHNRANVRRTTEASLEDFTRIGALADAAGGRTTLAAGISTAFGCTIEGAIDEGRVLALGERLVALGARELIVADTVGYAEPRGVRRLFRAFRDRLGPDVPLVGHFHDTRGLGLANSLAAIEAGVRWFDVSLGGLGGCPHAPGATGNVATEDMVFMAEAMGFDTGYDVEALLRCRAMLATMLPDTPLPGAIARAGLPLTFGNRHAGL
ncbi:hydroxymethylglutaryl-CoA lyase [Sphingomonas sp. YL-JM2C]